MATTNFGTCDVARVAGLPESVLRSWVERRIIVLSDEDRDAAGRGQPRLFSFETAMQVAIGAELARLGFGSRQGCLAARAFAHCGSNDRRPGELFRDSRTFLIIRPGATRAKVVKESDLPDVFAASGPHESTVAVVNINEIYRRVARALLAPLPDAAML